METVQETRRFRARSPLGWLAVLALALAGGCASASDNDIPPAPEGAVDGDAEEGRGYDDPGIDRDEDSAGVDGEGSIGTGGSTEPYEGYEPDEPDITGPGAG